MLKVCGLAEELHTGVLRPLPPWAFGVWQSVCAVYFSIIIRGLGGEEQQILGH